MRFIDWHIPTDLMGIAFIKKHTQLIQILLTSFCCGVSVCLFEKTELELAIFPPSALYNEDVNSMLLPFVSRLKKKSQSIDISASSYEPLAPAAQHAMQPPKPPPVTNTATSEEEQNNTANTQRRNPRRGELKRYYTIGEPKHIHHISPWKRVISFSEGKLSLWNNQSHVHWLGESELLGFLLFGAGCFLICCGH